MKTILLLIAVAILIFAAGFVMGMLVYRNNQKKAEALKNKATAEFEEIKDKADDIASVLKK